MTEVGIEPSGPAVFQVGLRENKVCSTAGEHDLKRRRWKGGEKEEEGGEKEGFETGLNQKEMLPK